MIDQPFRPQHSTGPADRQHFSMRCRVEVRAGLIACSGNNQAIRVHNDSTDRDFTALGGCTCLREGRLHMRVELHGLTCTQTVLFRKPDKHGMPRLMTSEPTPQGDRIAKVLSRAGVASRREAERMIEAGRVKVNGQHISSPALNVQGTDKITVDGKEVSPPEPARLWLYHKPTGLVTTDNDEKGRETIYSALPEDMPRVMSVGRLDINSEGLLLLTNDGGVKRRLELPTTGWLRRYRVRINGRPTDATLDPLRRGISSEGENFQPMQVTLDRQQGANAWLTVGLREGKNREIRRALAELDLSVNRLIRISYGPFQLGELKPGAVEEVRRKILRDQLGLEGEVEESAPKHPGAGKKRGPNVNRTRTAAPGKSFKHTKKPRK